MAFDYSDWQSQNHRLRGLQESLQDRQKLDRFAAQGVVPMQNLTGQPEWDLFLQLIQGRIDQYRGMLQSLQDQDLSATSVSHDELLSAQLNRRMLKNQIDILEEILGWPKELVEHGQKALKRMRDVDAGDSEHAV